MTFKFHFTVKGPASPISSLRSGQYIVLQSIQQRVGYGRRRLRRRARASAPKRLTPPPSKGAIGDAPTMPWGGAPAQKPSCPAKIHARDQILARKPSRPTKAALKPERQRWSRNGLNIKHQVRTFPIAKAFAHSRDFRGTTRFLCQNLPLTLRSAGRLKPCVYHAATTKIDVFV